MDLNILKYKMSSKTVAIIGAGPSGILSAKYCVQSGLCPTVFDINDQPGGLWVPGSKIWSSLYCNFTKHCMVFSDFPWSNVDKQKNKSSQYAHRDDIFEYLSAYIKHFDLESYFQCKTRVDSVEQIEADRWRVTTTNLKSMEKSVGEFDFVVIASGFNSIPNDPKIENSSEFGGLIMHSDSYKTNDERLKGKRVLVIGSSNSSVEVCSDLIGYSESVSNLFSRPFWVIPKFVETTSSDGTPRKIVLPRDFLFYTREFTSASKQNRKKYALICPDQANKETCPPDLYIDPESNQPANFGISEHYYRHVKEGRITTYLSKAKRYVKDGLELEDGRIVQADVIIYCTGFKLTMPYFGEDILSKLKYDANNYKNPIVLYNHTFHPDLKNMAFIFLTRGGFFTGMELQSKWASLVFSGQRSLMSEDYMKDVLARNEIKRKETHPSVQFPHGLYVEVVDSLAKEIGCFPSFDDNELNEKFNKCLVQPTNYVFHENRGFFCAMLDRCIEITRNGVQRDCLC